MTANFDRWESDPFFAAAEQVQDSADRLESVFRNWVYSRSETEVENDVEFIRRELQTALGTAKWQLDEFEKAVKTTYSEKDNGAVRRHKQFVSAIKSQITNIESALTDFFSNQNKQGGLRWVQLDDHEKDDLALFLSTPSDTAVTSLSQQHCAKNGVVEAATNWHKDTSKSNHHNISIPKSLEDSNVSGFKETILINRDSKFVVEMSGQSLPDHRCEEYSKMASDKNCYQKAVSSQGDAADLGAWKIVISGTDENCPMGSQVKGFLPFSVQAFAKKLGIVPARLKWYMNGVKRLKEHASSYHRQDAHSCNQHGWAGAVQKRPQRSHLVFQFSRPIQLTWILLVMLSLVGLFTFIAI